MRFCHHTLVPTLLLLLVPPLHWGCPSAVSTIGPPQACLALSGLPAHVLLSWKESSHFCLANSSSFFKPQDKAKLFFCVKLFLALPG